MKKKILDKLRIYFFIISIALFIISISITFVLLFRPFYYYHINYLNISKSTGYTYDEIKETYDDVIDYTVFNKEFKTGKLKYSEEGIDHFRDCQTLFRINFIILGITSIVILIKKKYFNSDKLCNYNLGFWSSVIVIGLFSIIVLISLMIGFDRFFELFHNIFFLGKDNWLLSESTDEIIKILPIEFFMNCAILIVSIIVIIAIIVIVKEIYRKKK